VHSRTLAQLRAEVRYLGDAEGLTARHPDADLTRRINAAVRAYRALVTANGLPYFIETTAAATLAGTQVSGEQYSEVPFPSTAEQILGVDVSSGVSSDDWYPLQVITWQARRNARWGYQHGGAPAFFAIRRVPQADPSDLDAVLAGVLALFPYSDQGSYKVHYLPSYVDMVADADLFVALPEACDWVVWHVVCDLAARDDDQRETAQLALMKKQECEARLLASVGRVQSAGPILPRRRGRRFGR
jgi:hypothetical protein